MLLLGLLLTTETSKSAVLATLAREATVTAECRLLLLLLLGNAGLRGTDDTVRGRAGAAGLAERRRGTVLRLTERLEGILLSGGCHAGLLSVAVLSEARSGACERVDTAEATGLVEGGALGSAAAVVVEAASELGAHAATGAHRSLLVLAESTRVCRRSGVLLVSGPVRRTVHAALLLALVTTIATGGLGVAELVLVGLLVRAVVVGVAVREAGVVCSLGLLVVAGSLVHRVLRLGRRLRVLVLARGDRVRGVVARAGSFAVAGLRLLEYVR